MEQAPYGMQAQSYPKGSLLDSLCPPAAAPGALSSEEFPMFPKSQLSAVGVGYCSVGQDFAGGSVNLMGSASGKELPRVPRRGLWVWFPGAVARQPHELLHQGPVSHSCRRPGLILF